MATSSCACCCPADSLCYEICEFTSCPSEVLKQQKQRIMTGNVLLLMGNNTLGTLVNKWTKQ